MLASCKGCDRADASASVDAAPAATRAALPAEADAGAPTTVDDVADAAVRERDDDAGDLAPSSCRLVYGPAEQWFRGPAALAANGRELRLVVNDAGIPRVHRVPITSPPRPGAPPVTVPAPARFTGMRWPPCVLAGRFAYCQGPGGPITRTVLDGEGAGATKTIATSQSGTRIDAASLGPDHSVVAFLDVRHTTEGRMLQAFVALDEHPPARLSDDGAGATTLRFLQRGDAAVAVYLDTRTAMVPVHARPVSLRDGALALGADTVLFVGGAPERGIDLAVASAGSAGFAFVPMPREVLAFGMAAIPIADPPKEDVPAAWSLYPNGLDPAPIGAAPARDGEGAWVARVRPRASSREGAAHAPAGLTPRVLELGRVDASGAFTSFGEVAPGGKITDVELAADAAGGVWILYGDPTVTWLERRICP